MCWKYLRAKRRCQYDIMAIPFCHPVLPNPCYFQYIIYACDLRFERRRSALLTDMCRSLSAQSGSHRRSKLMRATKMGVVKLNYYLLPPSAIPVSVFLIVVDSFPYPHLPRSSHLEDVLVNLVSTLDLIDPRPTHRSSPSQNQIDQFVPHRSTPSNT